MLSQGLIESTNTKIRLLTRIAFGFRSPEALIALAMLALGTAPPCQAEPNTRTPDMAQELMCGHRWDVMLKRSLRSVPG